MGFAVLLSNKSKLMIIGKHRRKKCSSPCDEPEGYSKVLASSLEELRKLMVMDRAGHPLMAEEAGEWRLKVTERSGVDEGMKEKGEMKGKGERYGGRPGGDQ